MIYLSSEAGRERVREGRAYRTPNRMGVSLATSLGRAEGRRRPDRSRGCGNHAIPLRFFRFAR
jgi:hypothetical protein